MRDLIEILKGLFIWVRYLLTPVNVVVILLFALLILSGCSSKPEPLKYELAGKWSRRINAEHRIVYSVHDDIIEVYIFSMRYHYSKK